MSMENMKGFTLIELLVVIAIIAMLSSIVLGSLSNARSKGNDATVKANLNNIRAQMQILYENNGGSYRTPTDGCTADPFIQKMITSAQTAAGGVVICTTAPSGSAWLVSSPLKGAGGYWCVDSGGTVKPEPSAPTGGATTCI